MAKSLMFYSFRGVKEEGYTHPWVFLFLHAFAVSTLYYAAVFTQLQLICQPI